MRIDTICKECKKIFLADTRELKRGNAKFCTRSCAKIFQNKNIVRKEKETNCNCSYCGIKFYRAVSRLNTKSGMHFCSRNCKKEAQKLTLSYSKDYRRTMRLTKGIKECEICGYNKYPDVLQIHHIDRNRGNNKPENLKVLCPTCHCVEHYLTGTGLYR